MDRKIDIVDITQRLKARSDFFCAAKWNELFLYLNHGNSNSCHHPLPHAIPEDLLDDPYVLHNTPHKLEQQRMMLSGQRPAECHMCWHIEDASSDAVSDRFVKSHRWQTDIEHLIPDPQHIPRFIEVVFDNLCNLNCSYCDSGQSSSWASRIQKNPIHLESDDRELYRTVYIKPGETKFKYVEAWLRWWPMIADRVEVLKISGGEPLISPSFWRFIDVMAHCPTLEFTINSNLSVEQHRLETFAQKSKNFQSIRISASIDAQNAIARYSRKGLDFDLFLSNCEFWCTQTPDNCFLNLQSTVSILSVWGFDQFLQLVMTLRKKYGRRVVTFYATVVRYPEFQSVSLLPKSMRWQVCDNIEKVLHSAVDVFDPVETLYINKILTYLRTDPKPPKDINPDLLRRDLRKFLESYDAYDNLCYRDVFPIDFVNWLDASE